MEGGPGGGDRCIHAADSFHCTAKTSTTLQSNYTPILKNNIKKKRSITLQTLPPTFTDERKTTALRGEMIMQDHSVNK